ncbi:MAG: glycosyltransferase [Bacteroidota bacterium]|nr:glycosyltransferase [Bacteroidota bacterium]
MSTPVVSVLTTSYNREKYIAQTIESVLASTFGNFEIIISDDGSNDATVDIARHYAEKDSRIRVYVNEKNLGDYNNRNKAATFAKGKYIKYVDSDDLIYEHTLEVMVRFMERFPAAGFGLCTAAERDRPLPIMVEPAQAYREHFGGEGHFFRAPASSIIKREAFEKVGGFSGKRMIGDNELWFKLARTYPMVKLVTGLSWDRLHGEQERFSAYALNYQKMLYDVVMEALTHNDCPLPEEERLEVIKKVNLIDRRQTMRNKLTRIKKLITK